MNIFFDVKTDSIYKNLLQIEFNYNRLSLISSEKILLFRFNYVDLDASICQEL